MEWVQRHNHWRQPRRETDERLAILGALRPTDLHFCLLSGNLSDFGARAGLVYGLVAKLSDGTWTYLRNSDMSCKEELPSQRRTEVCEDLHCTHDTKNHYRSKTRRVVEIAVCQLREGTAAMFTHSGMTWNGRRTSVGLYGRRQYNTREAIVLHNAMDRSYRSEENFWADTQHSARRQWPLPAQKQHAEYALSRLCTSSRRWAVNRSVDPVLKIFTFSPLVQSVRKFWVPGYVGHDSNCFLMNRTVSGDRQRKRRGTDSMSEVKVEKNTATMKRQDRIVRISWRNIPVDAPWRAAADDIEHWHRARADHQWRWDRCEGSRDPKSVRDWTRYCQMLGKHDGKLHSSGGECKSVSRIKRKYLWGGTRSSAIYLRSWMVEKSVSHSVLCAERSIITGKDLKHHRATVCEEGDRKRLLEVTRVAEDSCLSCTLHIETCCAARDSEKGIGQDVRDRVGFLPLGPLLHLRATACVLWVCVLDPVCVFQVPSGTWHAIFLVGAPSFSNCSSKVSEIRTATKRRWLRRIDM